MGVSEAERLITQEKVAIVTGTYQSGVALPVSEVAERYGIPFFAPVPSDDAITARGFKNTWRLADNSELRVIAQAQFIDDLNKNQNAGLKTAYLVYENTAWGQGVEKSWQKYLPEKGIQILGGEAYPQGAADFTPLANKLKAAKPDLIMLTSYVADASLLTNTFAEQKVSPKAFIGTSGGYSDPVYLKNTNLNAEYFYDVSSWEGEADHTAGNTIAAKTGQLDPAGKVALSRTVQIANMAMDMLGFCAFARGVSDLSPDAFEGFVAGRLGEPWSWSEVLSLALDALKREVAFNRAAGLGKETDRLPEWMRETPLPPHQALFDVDEAELARIWDEE